MNPQDHKAYTSKTPEGSLSVSGPGFRAKSVPFFQGQQRDLSFWSGATSTDLYCVQNVQDGIGLRAQ